MGQNRPKPPRRKYPGVAPIWSGGAWKFRARVRNGGRITYGPVRSSQEGASDDYRSLKGSAETAARGGEVTLGQGFQAARTEARARGAKPITIKAHFGEDPRGFIGHAGYLLKFWRPDTPLRLIDAAEVAWMIGKALKAGRSPNTMIGKDLVVLGQAFAAVGMDSPIAKAKRVARLQRVPGVKAGMEFSEARGFVQLVRESRTARSEWHADLIEFILWTGLRASELANLRAEHIDLKRGTVRLDGKSGHRAVAMDPELSQIAARLVQDAQDRGSAMIAPGGMNGVRQVIKRWSDRLGVEVTARGLRHTIALGMIEAGMSLDRVRDQLGHSKITTTAEYINRRQFASAENVAELRRHQAPRGGKA